MFGDDKGYFVRVTFLAPDSQRQDDYEGPVVIESYYSEEIPESFSVPNTVRRALEHEMWEWLKQDGKQVRDPHSDERLSGV